MHMFQPSREWVGGSPIVPRMLMYIHKTNAFHVFVVLLGTPYNLLYPFQYNSVASVVTKTK